MKNAIVVVWVACLAAFFLPASAWTVPGQRLFWAILVVHAIECVAFLPRLRRAGGSLGNHLAQTLLFGYVHVRGVGAGPAA